MRNGQLRGKLQECNLMFLAGQKEGERRGRTSRAMLTMPKFARVRPMTVQHTCITQPLAGRGSQNWSDDDIMAISRTRRNHLTKSCPRKDWSKVLRDELGHCGTSLGGFACLMWFLFSILFNVSSTVWNMGDRVTRNTGGNPLGTLEWLHNKEYYGMYPLVSDNKDHLETMLKRCQWCKWENFLWFRTCFRGDGYWREIWVLRGISMCPKWAESWGQQTKL